MRAECLPLQARVAQRIVAHVLGHSHGILKLPEVVNGGQLSRSHVLSFLGEQTGKSPAAFVKRIRLERAAHRLRHTSLAIGEIGAEAGYLDDPSFSRAFSQAFGMSPTCFRSARSQDWRLPAANDLHWRAPERDEGSDPCGPSGADAEVELVGIGPLRFGRIAVCCSYAASGEQWRRWFAGPSSPSGFAQGTRFWTLYGQTAPLRTESECRAELCIVRQDMRVQPGLDCGTLPAGVYVRTRRLLSNGEARGVWRTLLRGWGGVREGAREVALEEFEACPGFVPNPPRRAYLALELCSAENGK